MPNVMCRTIILAISISVAMLSNGFAGKSVETRGEPKNSQIQLAAIIPEKGVGVFDRVFECSGTIMHQSYMGALESPVSFWLGIRGDNSVQGAVTEIGKPLSLASKSFVGQFEPNHDAAGRFIGGRALLNWPHAESDSVELGFVRETYIRVGQRTSGVAKIRRQTSKHTYVAGSFNFDTGSHPLLNTFHRLSFIAATCVPSGPLSRMTDLG